MDQQASCFGAEALPARHGREILFDAKRDSLSREVKAAPTNDQVRAKPDRYVALDSLRGLCACMVLLYHFHGQGHLDQLSFTRGGWLFVDFFFVLSGFVIATSYGQRLANGFSIGRFMWLRLGRVFPLHVVMLLIFFGFELFFLAVPGLAGRRPFEAPYTVEALYSELALVQIFVGPDATPWNGPSWSIAAEVWTYLIFAIVLRHATRLTIPICAMIAVIAPIILYNLTDRYMYVGHDGALVRCLFGFSVGVMSWYAVPWIKRIDIGGKFGTAIEIAAIAIVVGFVSLCSSGPATLAAPFIFFLPVMIFSRERGIISTLLKTRPLETLGSLSYSIYMIHIFVLLRLVNCLSLFERVTGFDAVNSQDGHNYVGGGPWFSDLMTILFLALVIGLSQLTYRFIEKPGQDWSRRPIRFSGSAKLSVAP